MTYIEENNLLAKWGFTPSMLDSLRAQISHPVIKDELTLRAIVGLSPEKETMKYNENDTQINCPVGIRQKNYTPLLLLTKQIASIFFKAMAPFNAKKANDLFNIKATSLEQLIASCWNVGIPVLSLSNLHRSFGKPDSIVFIHQERPVICLGERDTNHARLMYTLLYALTHVTTGKLSGSATSIVDVSHDFLWGSLLSNNYPGEIFAKNDAEKLVHRTLQVNSSEMHNVVDMLATKCDPAELAFRSQELAHQYKLDASLILLCLANKHLYWDIVRDTFEFMPEVFIPTGFINHKQFCFTNYYDLPLHEQILLDSIMSGR